jgi:hypothetical protein
MYLKVIDSNDADKFKTYKKNYNWSIDGKSNSEKSKPKVEAVELSI